MIEDSSTLTRSVIPADAGIQLVPDVGKPGFRLALRLAGMTADERPATLLFGNRNLLLCNRFILPPSPYPGQPSRGAA